MLTDDPTIEDLERASIDDLDAWVSGRRAKAARSAMHAAKRRAGLGMTVIFWVAGLACPILFAMQAPRGEWALAALLVSAVAFSVFGVRYELLADRIGGKQETTPLGAAGIGFLITVLMTLFGMFWSVCVGLVLRSLFDFGTRLLGFAS